MMIDDSNLDKKRVQVQTKDYHSKLEKTRSSSLRTEVSNNQPCQYFMERMGFLGPPKVQEAYNIINF